MDTIGDGSPLTRIGGKASGVKDQIGTAPARIPGARHPQTETG